MSELQTLGGDVTSQFTYRPGGLPEALALCKAEQEAICGYPLIMTKSRETESRDATGPVFEVFVTFSPLPPAV